MTAPLPDKPTHTHRPGKLERLLACVRERRLPNPGRVALLDRMLHPLEFRRRRVNFIIGGAMKSGSTALAKFVSRHPDVCFSIEKEVNFFLNKPFTADDHAYHKCFPRPGRRQAIGEGSARYLYHSHARTRIQQYNPDMRMIFILRNPIERAYSHYQMHVHRKDLDVPFLECLRLSEQATPPETLVHPCQPMFNIYLDYSIYVEHIVEYRKSFRHVLCLRQEELAEDHDDTLRRVFDFIGVDPHFKQERRTIHSYTYTSIPTEIWDTLLERMEPEIVQLEKLTGWNLTHWRRPAERSQKTA